MATNLRDPQIAAILQSWTFEPWIVIPALIAGGLYVHGWCQLHRRFPRRFAVWRMVAFQTGLLTLFFALASPLHPLAELLLQFHMIQHLLLMMVVPPLLLLGAPILPLLRGMPRPVLQYGLSHVFGSPALQKVAPDPSHPGENLVEKTGGEWIGRAPYIEGVAVRGDGVFDTLKAVSKLVLKTLS